MFYVNSLDAQFRFLFTLRSPVVVCEGGGGGKVEQALSGKVPSCGNDARSIKF